MLVEFHLNFLYSFMVGKNFQIYGFHIHINLLDLIIFTRAPYSYAKTPIQFLFIASHEEGNYSSPKNAFYFENLFPPTAAERSGGIFDWLYQNLVKYMKMAWNIRLFIFCTICIFFKYYGFLVF